MRIFDVLREWNGGYVMVQVDDGAVGDDGRPRLLLGRALALDDGLQLHCPGWVSVFQIDGGRASGAYHSHYAPE